MFFIVPIEINWITKGNNAILNGKNALIGIVIFCSSKIIPLYNPSLNPIIIAFFFVILSYFHTPSAL